jgi:hypothetical protein
VKKSAEMETGQQAGDLFETSGAPQALWQVHYFRKHPRELYMDQEKRVPAPDTDTPHRIFVFDTFARSAAGRILHFDVVLPENDHSRALEAARAWLAGLGLEGAVVNPENCCYCHSEPTAPTGMRDEIASRGFAIYKLEGCPK